MEQAMKQSMGDINFKVWTFFIFIKLILGGNHFKKNAPMYLVAKNNTCHLFYIFLKPFHIVSLGNQVSSWKKKHLIQGMVDGSASEPALRQDTGYMVEKTYLDIAPYLGAFGAYLMPQ